MQIEEAIKKVSVASDMYFQQKTAISSSSPRGVIIVNALKSLKKAIEAMLSTNNLSEEYRVTVSKGQSNLPRNLYVAVVRSLGKLSTEPCVCLCFNEQGTGFVLGMMYPQNYMKNTKYEKVRRNENEIKINLNSKRSKANFNNLYVNPMEFLVEAIDFREFENQLKESIQLLASEYKNEY